MNVNKPSTFNLEEFFKSGQVPDELKKCILESQKAEVFIEMLPDIFHKLRNKLTPIMGYTQILYLKISDDETRDKLNKIEKNADELCLLLDQLRNYFKKGKNVKTRINLNDIIHHLKTYFRDIEKHNKIKVKIDMDKNIPDDYLNHGQIENLIMNMIDNAVLAIEKINEKNSNFRSSPLRSGKIQIKTQRLESDYQLIIKDNGIGIKKETLSKIWLPFYSRFSGRTGIGLLGCKRIISNHNARVQVHSQEGIGTEFEILFQIKP